MLVIIADGRVDVQAPTIKAMVEASEYPLSIVMIGVGDGPCDVMTKFDDQLKAAGRKFDNFQFIELNKIMRGKNPTSSLPLYALLELPGLTPLASITLLRSLQFPLIPPSSSS